MTYLPTLLKWNQSTSQTTREGGDRRPRVFESHWVFSSGTRDLARVKRRIGRTAVVKRHNRSVGFEDGWVAEVSGFPGFFIHSVRLAPGGMKRASV